MDLSHKRSDTLRGLGTDQLMLGTIIGTIITIGALNRVENKTQFPNGQNPASLAPPGAAAFQDPVGETLAQTSMPQVSQHANLPPLRKDAVTYEMLQGKTYQEKMEYFGGAIKPYEPNKE